jgi:uncharacterized tellurite resistance protein B-like protein
VGKIVAALEHLEAERARYIAAFAYLLGRVAHADRVTSPEESREMERIVGEWGNLSQDHAALVVEIAKSQSASFGGTENFLVGREFDRIATHEQKIALLHCLYAVCSADRSVSSTEDHEIRKIARELKLSHSEYIDVRLTYREHLAVLKKSPRAPKP